MLPTLVHQGRFAVYGLFLCGLVLQHWVLQQQRTLRTAANNHAIAGHSMKPSAKIGHGNANHVNILVVF